MGHEQRQKLIIIIQNTAQTPLNNKPSKFNFFEVNRAELVVKTLDEIVIDYN